MRFSAAALITAFSLTFCASAQPIDWHDPQTVADLAVASSPALQRIEADVRAARERVSQVDSWPNPMVMGGVRNMPVDLSPQDMTMYIVGVSQSIPRGSRRNALRAAAEAEVRRIELESASIDTEVRRNALFAWYEVAGSDSSIAALRKVADALDAVVEAARARYESGTTIQADIVRAQLQRSEVEHQILGETGQRRTYVSRLLALLGVPLATEVPALSMSHGTGRATIEQPREIPDSHPAIAALGAEVERREQELRIATLQTRPDIDIEASYGLRPSRTDMVSLVARIELPFRKRTLIEPRIREATALRDAAGQRIEELRRELVAGLGAAWEAHDLATRQLAFHDEVLVPQSQLAVESTRAAYESGGVTLDAVLAVEAAWLRLETDYYGFLVAHVKAIIDFNAIREGARAGLTGGAMSSAPGTRAMPAPSTSMGMR